MMEYKDIVVLDSPHMKKSIEMVSDFLNSLDCEKEIKDLMVEQLGLFNDWHFNKDISKHIIEKMVPAVGNESICNVLKMNGIDCYRAKDMVHEAYALAVNKASDHGWKAPKIPEKYNEWDYYTVFAMIISDHWMTIDGDMGKAAILAYEFMSDPDSNCSKVWDYFF